MRRRQVDKRAYYRGMRTVPYDLLKELSVAMVATLAVVLVLAAVLSSPDVPSVTIQSWAQRDPVDFVTTASAELSGGTTSSAYGPPYNAGDASLQHWGFLQPQAWAGMHQPVDAAGEFVLRPLQLAATSDGAVGGALQRYTDAGADQQGKWLRAYQSALAGASVSVHGSVVVVKPGDYGPVPVLMDNLLRLAQNGALDGLLLASAHFYQTDYTAPLLFMGDGGYLPGLAQNQSLTGSQWGMMNETGRYPGQAWLWLYTMWYQVAPYNRDAAHGIAGVNAGNADLAVVVTMAILSALLVLVPFIPGLRDLPRWIPIHRLIWRGYYAEERRKL